MKRIVTIIFLCLIYTIQILAQTNLYKARRLSVADGLPSNTIRAIVQDPNGYIWVGGTAGLSRFDGYRFVNFNGKNELQKNTTQHIGKLVLDKEDNLLWLSTNTFNYACINLYTDKFTKLISVEGGSAPFNSRYQSTDGIWIYNKEAGARHIYYREGKLSVDKFTKQDNHLPSNKINNIFEDNKHNIWISTDNGICKVDAKGQHSIYLKGCDIIASDIYNQQILCFDHKSQSIFIITLDGKIKSRCKLASMMGRIDRLSGKILWQGKWIIFTSDKSYALDIAKGIFDTDEEYQIPKGYVQGKDSGYIFVANKSGYLWVFTPNGNVKKLMLNPNAIFSNDKNSIYQFDHDENGIIYIASYGSGLITLNPKTWQTHQYTAEDDNPLIYTNYLLDVMVDKSNCIWVTTEGAGISCISPIGGPTTNFYIPDDSKKGDWSNYVRLIYKAKDKKIYAVTRNNKIYNYQPEKGFSFVKHIESSIYSYLLDSKGNEWMLTRGEGFYVNQKHYSTKELENKIDCDNFFDAIEDKAGRVWLASWGKGLYMIEYKDGKANIKQYLNKGYNMSRVHDLELSKDGTLWIATYDGIYYLDSRKKDIKEQDFGVYNMNNHKLPNDEVVCLKVTDDNTLWAGITGCGLIKCNLKQGKAKMTIHDITTEEGLSNNNIRTIAEDKYGYIWASAEEGISRIDPKDNTVSKYTASTNLQSNFFSENSYLNMPDGKILFGTGYGMAEINPADNRHKTHVVYIQPALITDILINGMSILNSIGEDSVSLEQSLTQTEKINLKYYQNSISIFYSNFNFRDMGSQLYAYYLEGVDKTWRKTTSSNFAEYNSLKPGTYTFHIKAFSNNQWSKETTLSIHINQPWYNSWWAWLIYILIIGGGSYYYYIDTRNKMKMNQKIAMEKKLSDFRIAFFTNITHEFRTPLAIIQNAMNKISNSQGTISQNAIQTASRGTRRLLRLVNQLMEFRKISSGNERLQVEKDDIVEFVREIYQDMWSLSKQKEISLIYTPFQNHYSTLFDKDSIETICYNLISNAIKYTPSKGNVEVHLSLDNNNIKIEVYDTGKGISEQQQQALFTPFMQGNTSRGGMGIGLYTAHRLAEIHHGELCYQSRKEGGSIFTLTIPASDSSYLPDEYKKVTAITREKDEIKQSEEIIRELKPEALNHQKVAIIEDDPDMMQQISDEISVYFHTSGYTTGEDGLDGIMNNKPDMILCDVMLPDTNGYEIVKRLKQNKEYQGIPVIMLTALDDEDHQIKGYMAGADDYMVKPCNFTILIARMIQLMQWRINSSGDEKYMKSGPAIVTEIQEKRFQTEVENTVISHLSDPAFSVDILAASMKMGRTKFYGKMKDLYGISPNKYIMNIRMQKAAELISQGEYTMAEIGYKVGISDSSYFNKCFKQRFGVPPSKFRR